MKRSIASVDELSGIGPVLRQRVIAELGMPPGNRNATPREALAVEAINANPYVIYDVPGIGLHRLARIMEDNFGVLFGEVSDHLRHHYRGFASSLVTPRDAARATVPVEVRAQLSELPGMGPKLAERTINHLQALHAEQGKSFSARDALAYVEQHPYVLMDVPGVGFKKADAIARGHFKVPADAPERHEHANRHLLSSRGGVMPEHEYHANRERLGLRNRRLATLGVQFDLGHVWDREELISERELAAWAVTVCSGAEPDLPAIPSDVLNDMHAFGLNEEQRRAAWAGMELPAMALTGGAGTGKTTTIAALASLASKRGSSVHLMAFAGKGADRIGEALHAFGIDTDTTGPFGNTAEQPNISHRSYGRVFVSTIHRGLAATGDGQFHVEELTGDLIILDEASMLPNQLLTKVLERMKAGARLVLVGDPHQLPPIQYGAPFENLIRLGLPHVRLVQNYRQANQQSIFELAEAVRAKRPREARDEPGVRLLFEADFDRALLEVVTAVQRAPETRDPLAWQAVCALNVTRERVNHQLQQLLNPDGVKLAQYREFASGSWVEIRQGDKIVVVKNDYEKSIFNGMTGRVLGVEPARSALTVQVGEQVVHIEYDLVPALLRLGYAITTHKSQGSGWHTVVVAEPDAHHLTPNRWAYTSITRASDLLVLITSLSERAWWNLVMRDPLADTGSLSERVNSLLVAGAATTPAMPAHAAA